MTREELEQLKSTVKQWLFHTGSLDPTNYANDLKVKFIEPREKRIEQLEAQIEKLIDFVLSKTECCDVCPITDTCINSEGTCPYAGMLAKGEEKVTREWLMQFISGRLRNETDLW